MIEALEKSNQEIVGIGVEAGTIWYIMKNENDVDETIKFMIVEKDCVFQEKDGAGLFFEKDGERLIETTEMWSKKICPRQSADWLSVVLISKFVMLYKLNL